MAQTIMCDFDGCEAEHDLIVSLHTNGDTSAFCFEHMVLFCQSYIAQWEEANPPAPPVEDDEPEPEPAPAPAELAELLELPGAVEPERDYFAEPYGSRPGETGELLEREPAAGQLDRDDANWMDDVHGPADPNPPVEPDPGVAQVVKRGTSPSRRAHEARRREKARQSAAGSDPE